MSKITKEKLYLHVEVPCVETEGSVTKAMYFAKVYPQDFPNRRVVRVLSHLLAESDKKCNEVHKTLVFQTDTNGWYFGWQEEVSVKRNENDEDNPQKAEKALYSKIELHSMKVYRRLICKMDSIGRTALLSLQRKTHKVSREIAKQKQYIKKTF